MDILYVIIILCVVKKITFNKGKNMAKIDFYTNLILEPDISGDIKEECENIINYIREFLDDKIKNGDFNFIIRLDEKETVEMKQELGQILKTAKALGDKIGNLNEAILVPHSVTSDGKVLYTRE
jgi:hypothetical protein